MTDKILRDEFAMAAMQGEWASHNYESMSFLFNKATQADFERIAHICYRMADAMMKAREIKGG